MGEIISNNLRIKILNRLKKHNFITKWLPLSLERERLSRRDQRDSLEVNVKISTTSLLHGEDQEVLILPSEEDSEDKSHWLTLVMETTKRPGNYSHP